MDKEQVENTVTITMRTNGIEFQWVRKPDGVEVGPRFETKEEAEMFRGPWISEEEKQNLL